MVKPGTDGEDKDGCLQRLRTQHAALWKRVMDYVLTSREEAQLLPHEKPMTHPRHHLARESNQRRSPVPRKSTQHVHPAAATQVALVGPCAPNGRWAHSQGHSLRGTGRWEKKHWATPAEIQGCLQERHEKPGHQHRLLGSLGIRPLGLERHATHTTPGWRGKDDGSSSRKTCTQKKRSHQQINTITHRYTVSNIHMRCLRQGLPLPHRPFQSQKAMLKSYMQNIT